MTIRTSSILKDAIDAASEALGLRPVFIEKDYWVTQVLQNLSRSEFVERVVFKGGTSLSKAYKCIKRFSEGAELSELIWEGKSPEPQSVLEVLQFAKKFLRGFSETERKVL